MKTPSLFSFLLIAFTGVLDANANSGSGGAVVAGVAIGASDRNIAIANSNIQGA